MSGPGDWLDEIDLAILDEVRAAHTLLDPPPADLDARVRFAIALESVDVEVARLAEEVLLGSGARGAERTRTMTFDAPTLTIMVSLADRTDTEVRLDGWLAPPGPLRVELRIAEPAPDAGPVSRAVTADATGRFVFDRVGRGLVQLLVHRPAEPDTEPAAESGSSVVTPSFML